MKNLPEEATLAFHFYFPFEWWSIFKESARIGSYKSCVPYVKMVEKKREGGPTHILNNVENVTLYVRSLAVVLW